MESPHGVDKTVYYLSRAQALEGAKVAVFCLSPKPVIPIPGVEVANFTPRRNPFALAPELEEATRRWRPDFIHLHCPWQPSNVPLARLARRLGIPYTITAHGNLSPRLLKRNPLFKLPYKLLFDAPIFHRAAFVHAIADMDDIRAYGITRPLVIAPNGFELGDVPSPLDPARAGFPDLTGSELLLFLGRLDTAQKGLDLLLEAFARLHRERPAARLALAGPDWKGSRLRLEALARELGIAAAVTFCGPVTGDAKYHLMSAARAFVHPSRWEAGIPFSVLEALATGTPCLLSTAADPGRMVERHGAGITVENEPDSLASGLRAMLDASPEQRGEKANRARELIRTQFAWEKSARTLLDAYRDHASPAPCTPRSSSSPMSRRPTMVRPPRCS